MLQFAAMHFKEWIVLKAMQDPEEEAMPVLQELFAKMLLWNIRKSEEKWNEKFEEKPTEISKEKANVTSKGKVKGNRE